MSDAQKKEQKGVENLSVHGCTTVFK